MFESLGFTHSNTDHSLFYKDEDGDLLIVTVYIDNKLMFSKNLNAIKCLKTQLSEHFKITDLGNAHWILAWRCSAINRKALSPCPNAAVMLR